MGKRYYSKFEKPERGDHRPYMVRMDADQSNPDKIDLYVPDDSDTITWGELMFAIDTMEWFIVNERYSMVRRGANWILGHVVRRLKLNIMVRKGADYSSRKG